MASIKEATIYRLKVHSDMVVEKIMGGLQQYAFQPCGKTQELSHGFTPVADNNFVLMGDHLVLFRYKIEEKILPKAVIEHHAEKRIVEAEEKNGKPLSKQEKEQIKEAVRIELLPRAFSLYKTIDAYIDTQNGWLVVGSCNNTVLDYVLSAIRQVVSGFSSELMVTRDEPSAKMTAWIFQEALDFSAFWLGDSAKITNHDGGAINCRKEDLQNDDIIELCQSRQVKQLTLESMHYTFDITEHMQIKRLKIDDAYTESHINSDEEEDKLHYLRVNAFVTQQTISEIMNTLIKAFGGLVEEKAPEEKAA
ncbi:recombination-associated protein RdgC [Spartinivicinus marinus]|uniref:recombination-associated protein RdgC n=1 Tax=Spartinivicinus marinus TaxID=2994442 RepID=UPI00225AB9E4|nr:recombination-associated protein RdgC [Spartinivicinus marinus]MCX4025195.1 recombination-associated protein RdgC [Spartinivicinus marinus]